MSHRRDAKISQQDLATWSDQHIAWLNIAMNQFTLMRVIEGFCHLLHIANNLWQLNLLCSLIVSCQGSTLIEGHDQKGCTLFFIEIQDAHNIGVIELGDDLGLVLKILSLVLRKVSVENLYRSLRL